MAEVNDTTTRETLPFSLPMMLAGMFCAWCLLFAWPMLAVHLNCPGTLVVLVPVWALIGMSLSEGALLRRRVFVAQYLRDDGPLARWLGRPVLLLLWQGIKGLFLTLVLLTGSLLAEPLIWILLLGDILLMTLLLKLFHRLMSGDVKPIYGPALGRIWAQYSNTLILWLAFIAAMLVTARENFSGMAWQEVVDFSAAQVAAGCDVIALLARVGSVSDASLWWAAQQILGELQGADQVLIGWILFLAGFGASFLVAWGFSRLLLGAVARPWLLFRYESGDNG